MNHTNRATLSGQIAILAAIGQLIVATLPAAEPTAAKLEIDVGHPGAKINPALYGMMTEEINHSYDGGLYAELVRNRGFADDPKNPVHWTLIRENGEVAAMEIDRSIPLNSVLTNSLRLDAGNSTSSTRRAGVANDGYWGIPVRPNTHYRASFYARILSSSIGPVTVAIESDDGKTIYAEAKVRHLTGNWKKYTVTLATGKVTPTSKARLVLSVNHPGSVWFSLVSLFPPTWHNRPNGNRVDLMQTLADMKPGFLRLPGGNYLEGETIATRFPWKETLGDLTARPGHPGCWGYRSSDGLGLLEFLEWAEDLKAETVLAVYAGFSLPPKRELVNPGPELQPYVAEALEEIEYAIGDTHTKWGERRAADGHPAPFTVKWIEVGNEDWFDESGSYDGRFAQFYDAIKAKYPQLGVISTVGNEQPAKKLVHSRKPDALDEHYYRSAADFEKEAPYRFDKYDRNGPKIFVGEWGAYENIVPWDPGSRKLPPTPGMKAALGDAAWMAAMERNSDLIVMQCYAPMLVNVNPGARQWRPNLIGYDALNVFGSPSYHAFKMFSANRGNVTLPAILSGLPESPVAPLDHSVTRDTSTGAIYIKMVNVTTGALLVNISLEGLLPISAVGRNGTAITLAGNPDESNSINDPRHLVPVASAVHGIGRTFDYSFPADSITVLKVNVLP